MAEAGNSPQESTYVFNAESATEMNRLTIQDRLLTKEMGSLLPANIDPSKIHKVLDLACGPGGWVLDLASAYRHMEVVGVDLSEKMIAYANSRKWPNTSFRVMDIRQPLDFPDETFDFVNARLLYTFMPKNAWSPLLEECKRILRPGGFVRLTESDTLISNTPAFDKVQTIIARAMHLTGRTFSPEGTQIGITPMLGGFLYDAGYQNIQHSAFAIDLSAHGDAHESIYQNFQIGFLTAQPFLLQMTHMDATELAVLCQNALREMESGDFRALWYYLSVWGSKAV